MATERRKFTEEFKRGIVKRLATETVRAVADELKIHDSVLRHWKKGTGIANLESRPQNTSKHPEAFRREAVRQVYEAGGMLKTVAAELKVAPASIRKWRGQFAAEKGPRPTIKIGAGLKPRNSKGRKVKKKNYYVPVAKRRKLAQLAEAQEAGLNGGSNDIRACISLLRGIRTKVDTGDPIHLTAMLVLATLEGKM